MNTFRFDSRDFRSKKGPNYESGKVSRICVGLRNNLEITLRKLDKYNQKASAENSDRLSAEKREAEKLESLKSLVNNSTSYSSSTYLISLNRNILPHPPDLLNRGPSRPSSYQCCKHRERTSLPHLSAKPEHALKARPQTAISNDQSRSRDREASRLSQRRKGYLLPTTSSISKCDRIDATLPPSQVAFSPKIPIPKKELENINNVVMERQRNYTYTSVRRRIRSRRQLEQTCNLGQLLEGSLSSNSADSSARSTKLYDMSISNRLLQDRVKTFVRDIDVFNKTKTQIRHEETVQQY